MIKGAQGRPREKMAHKMYQPDHGQLMSVTVEDMRRRYLKNSSFREWEKLNVGKVRPDYIVTKNEKRASL